MNIFNIKLVCIFSIAIISPILNASSIKHERKFKGIYLLEDFKLLKQSNDSSLVNHAKTTYYYDSIQMLRDTVVEKSPIAKKDGTLRPEVNNQYFFRVKPQYDVYSQWDEKKHKWINVSVHKYVFDTTSKTKTSIRMEWNSWKKDWVNTSKTIKQFDQNWNLISNDYYKYEKENKKWIPVYEDKFEYKNNKQAMSLSVNYEEGKLKKKIKSVYEVDSLGNKIKEQCFLAKNDSDIWQPLFIHEMEYNNKKLITKIVSTYSNNQITKRTRVKQEYDLDEKIISRSWEEYNFRKNIWEEQNRKTVSEYMEIIENIKKGIKYEDE